MHFVRKVQYFSKKFYNRTKFLVQYAEKLVDMQ